MYKIELENRQKSCDEIWKKITEYLEKEGHFESVNGVKYTVTSILEARINYRGDKKGTRRGKGETMTIDEFFAAFDPIREREFNTTIVKEFIDRKQSPFVGLLLSVGLAK